MVVKRRISKDKYVMAAIFTILIFSLGLALGIIMDYERLRWIDKLTKEYDVDFRSLQFQALYMGTLEKDNASCDVLYATLERAIADLGASLENVLEYEKQSKVKRDDFNIIRRRYLIDNLKYWLFAKEAKQLCDLDVVNILYFYSEDECNNCPAQGTILTYYKKIFDDKLLIFPLNLDLEKDEPILEILRRKYKAYNLPTIIVEEKKYEGVVNKAELGKIICRDYKGFQEECKGILY